MPVCSLCFLFPTVFLTVKSCAYASLCIPSSLFAAQPHSSLSCCIYCIPLPSLPAVRLPHCCLHFIPSKLIFLHLSCYPGWSVTHRLVSLCVHVFLCVLLCFVIGMLCVCMCYKCAACWISFCGCAKCAVW